eukprot:CAMPEP_0113709752 /NCGR_PEP_ID=MMETSP0038_2-20120614/29754_1 /TAXON_ID=2898 /ORGANISM="Cryptomonas paramecium" /LENGTH=253 /DNA_ID=CAMNT_0000635689 /DNA_START=361 /DNA_END=1119 /DNA_ORIENTATION=+ /assembly_acc=CAM_ASM_000170
MIRRIVEASRKFCYLPNFANYEASVGDVGVVAEITDVEFMANGRANLQAKCKDRIKIVEQWEEDGTQGLRWCKVQLVVDEPPSDPSALQTCTRTCKDAYESFIDYHGETLRAQIEATYGKQPEDPEKFSFWISSILPIPYEDKQALLETSNTEERLSFCMQIMSLAITSGGGSSGNVPGRGCRPAAHAFTLALAISSFTPSSSLFASSTPRQRRRRPRETRASCRVRSVFRRRPRGAATVLRRTPDAAGASAG